MLTVKRFLLIAAINLFSLNGQAREVTATVYDQWYDGRITYCGKTYNHYGTTAAHPWLPCGTRVKVTLRNKTVVVPITDRCDCNSIDLSAGAAIKLGMGTNSTAIVNISY